MTRAVQRNYPGEVRFNFGSPKRTHPEAAINHSISTREREEAEADVIAWYRSRRHRPPTGEWGDTSETVELLTESNWGVPPPRRVHVPTASFTGDHDQPNSRPARPKTTRSRRASAA